MILTLFTCKTKCFIVHVILAHTISLLAKSFSWLELRWTETKILVHLLKPTSWKSFSILSQNSARKVFGLTFQTTDQTKSFCKSFLILNVFRNFLWHFVQWSFACQLFPYCKVWKVELQCIAMNILNHDFYSILAARVNLSTIKNVVPKTSIEKFWAVNRYIVVHATDWGARLSSCCKRLHRLCW